MNNSKRLWIVAAIVLLLLLALAAFFFWLTGGQDRSGENVPGREEGLIHVKSIYVFDTNRNLVKPVGIGADRNGNFFVTLRDSAVVVQFDRNGNYVSHFGERGLAVGNMMVPLGTAVDSLAGHVYVVDRSRFRLICFSTQGEYLWEVTLLNPLNVVVGPDGDVYVLTFGPIVHLTAQGELVQEVGSRGFSEGQFDFPRGAVALADDELIIADTNNTRLQRVKLSGELTATVEWVEGTPPRFQDDPNTRFGLPTGVAVDGRGRIVVMDGFRHTLEMLDPETREVLTDFGGEREGNSAGMFNLPTGIVRLYGDTYAVTDTFNDRVQIIRLIAPGDRNPLTLYPWLKWLLPLLLLPLLLLFGRKRIFVTEETLERALDEGKARLVIGVYRKLHALPEVVDRFADTMEVDVRMGDFLVPVQIAEETSGDVEPDAAAPETTSAEEMLARAAERSRIERLLLRRHLIVCADPAQCTRVEELKGKPVSYEELLEEYAIAEEAAEAPAQE